MPIRNFMFHAHAPTLNLDEVRRQIRLAHIYNNRLRELDLTRRAASEATIRRISPEYAAMALIVDTADARVEAAYEVVKVIRRRNRTRTAATPEQQREIDQATTALKAVRQQAKPIKDAAYRQLTAIQAPYYERAESVVDAVQRPRPLTAANRKRLIRQEVLSRLADDNLDAGQLAYECDCRAARDACGCYWGTYLAVEDSVSKIHKGPPPKFRRWVGEGYISVQLQKTGNPKVALTFEAACGGRDTRLQIELRNEEELYSRGKSHGRRAIGVVRMRIGSDENSRPIWTEFPVIFHRPVPRTAEIKYAFLHCRNDGSRKDWSFRLVIDTPVAELPTPSHKLCVVHPGYRMMENGNVRAATLQADHLPDSLFIDPELAPYLFRSGDLAEVILPAKWIELRDRAAGMDTYRDRLLNLRAPRLIQWLRTHASILPAWLTEAIETIGLWRSQNSFRNLCERWYANRFAGDEAVFELFNRWRRRDIHVQDYQYNIVRKCNARREQLYRVLARRLADLYEVVALPDIDWKELRKRPGVTADARQVERQRMIAAMVSPGRLTELVAEAGRERYRKLDAQNITAACFNCGQIDEWDRVQRWHTCSRCQTHWDQDHNAAHNEFARASVPPIPAAPLAGQNREGVTDENTTNDGAAPTNSPATLRRSRRNRRRDQLE